jgi:hypothetical protein
MAIDKNTGTGTVNGYKIGQNADLSNADLSNADLRSADLQGANLTNANLSGADLTKADLTNSVLAFSDLTDAILNGTDLSFTDLFEANLTNAFLKGAILPDARLRNANLTDANLSNANLSGASLRNVNLSGSNLSGANLVGADFRYAKVESRHVPLIEAAKREEMDLISVIGGRASNPSGRKTDYALGRKNNPSYPINVVALKALHKQFEKLVIQEFGNSGPDEDDEEALVEYQIATDALISLDTIIDMLNSGEPPRKIDSEIQSFYHSGEAAAAAMYIDIKRALPKP